LCTGTHLIQLDADEIIVEPNPGMIRQMVDDNRKSDVLDLACFNFYGDTETIRIEQNMWKWRITRNDPNIIHGVHADARDFDGDKMCITMDKKISDGCEYIYKHNLKICDHKFAFDPRAINLHEAMKHGQVKPEIYAAFMDVLITTFPVVFHYSWLDLERKTKNGEMWDQTYHGKKNATHNTTNDIQKRIKDKKDMLLKVTFDHPLRRKEINVDVKQEAESNLGEREKTSEQSQGS